MPDAHPSASRIAARVDPDARPGRIHEALAALLLDRAHRILRQSDEDVKEKSEPEPLPNGSGRC